MEQQVDEWYPELIDIEEQAKLVREPHCQPEICVCANCLSAFRKLMYYYLLLTITQEQWLQWWKHLILQVDNN